MSSYRRLSGHRIAAALGALFLATLAMPASSSGATTVGFSVGTGPAPGSTALAGGGSYFAPTVASGASYHGSVLIANANHNTVSVRIYPVEGLTSPGSGTAYSNEGSTLAGAGAWITVSRPSVLLAANSRAIVAFTVTVPTGSAPGNHLAGVAVEGTSPQVAKTKSNVQVNVVTRSVVGVLVTVPGKAVFSLDVGKPDIKLGTYKIGTVVIPLTDTGGLLGHPTLKVTLSKGSSYSKSVTKAVDTILPGDTTDILTFWPDKLSGRYQITACATGAGLPAAVCSSGSAVAPASSKTPSSGSGPFPTQVTTPTGSSHSSSNTLLVLLVAILGGIILVGGGVLLGSKLGRRRSGGSSNDPRSQDG